MATWQDVLNNPEFDKETPENKAAIRDDFFNNVIRPQVIESGDDVDAVYNDFKSKNNFVPETPEYQEVNTPAQPVNVNTGPMSYYGGATQQQQQEPVRRFGYQDSGEGGADQDINNQTFGEVKRREAENFVKNYPNTGIDISTQEGIDKAYQLSITERATQAAQMAVETGVGIATGGMGAGFSLPGRVATQAVVGAIEGGATQLAANIANQWAGGARETFEDVGSSAAFGAAGNALGSVLPTGVQAVKADTESVSEYLMKNIFVGPNALGKAVEQKAAKYSSEFAKEEAAIVASDKTNTLDRIIAKLDNKEYLDPDEAAFLKKEFPERIVRSDYEELSSKLASKKKFSERDGDVLESAGVRVSDLASLTSGTKNPLVQARVKKALDDAAAASDKTLPSDRFVIDNFVKKEHEASRLGGASEIPKEDMVWYTGGKKGGGGGRDRLVALRDKYSTEANSTEFNLLDEFQAARAMSTSEEAKKSLDLAILNTSTVWDKVFSMAESAAAGGIPAMLRNKSYKEALGTMRTEYRSVVENLLKDVDNKLSGRLDNLPERRIFEDQAEGLRGILEALKDGKPIDKVDFARALPGISDKKTINSMYEIMSFDSFATKKLEADRNAQSWWVAGAAQSLLAFLTGGSTLLAQGAAAVGVPALKYATQSKKKNMMTEAYKMAKNASENTPPKLGVLEQQRTVGQLNAAIGNITKELAKDDIKLGVLSSEITKLERAQKAAAKVGNNVLHSQLADEITSIKEVGRTLSTSERKLKDVETKLAVHEKKIKEYENKIKSIERGLTDAKLKQKYGALSKAALENREKGAKRVKDYKEKIKAIKDSKVYGDLKDEKVKLGKEVIAKKDEATVGLNALQKKTNRLKDSQAMLRKRVKARKQNENNKEGYAAAGKLQKEAQMSDLKQKQIVEMTKTGQRNTTAGRGLEMVFGDEE